jgi:hypothetical protein
MPKMSKVPKVKEFYPSRASGSNDHLTENGEEVAQFYFENEDDDEYEDKSDANGIINSTSP